MVEMIRTIWSFTYLCPSCGDEMVFYEVLNAQGGVPQRCPSCGSQFARRSWPRGEDVPVEVGQEVCETDLLRMRAASKDARLGVVPSLPIEQDAKCSAAPASRGLVLRKPGSSSRRATRSFRDRKAL